MRGPRGPLSLIRKPMTLAFFRLLLKWKAKQDIVNSFTVTFQNVSCLLVSSSPTHFREELAKSQLCVCAFCVAPGYSVDISCNKTTCTCYPNSFVCGGGATLIRCKSTSPPLSCSNGPDHPSVLPQPSPPFWQKLLTLRISPAFPMGRAHFWVQPSFEVGCF